MEELLPVKYVTVTTNPQNNDIAGISLGGLRNLLNYGICDVLLNEV